MSVLVSIITVSYNSEATIAQTIEAVLNQTYTNIEYWIIDGKSKDNTIAIAESYTDKFKEKGMKYTIISESDHGIYDAMNKGVKLSTGKVIGIINSDDWYELYAIEKVVETYEKTDFDMMYADLRMIRPNNSFVIKHSRERKLASSRYWNHPTSFITKKVYDRFQYKQESVHDDFDLLLRIKKAGYKIVIINEVLANFRFGGVSHEISLAKAIERIKIRYRIYRNNGYSRLYMFECVAIEAAKFLIA